MNNTQLLERMDNFEKNLKDLIKDYNMLQHSVIDNLTKIYELYEIIDRIEKETIRDREK